MQLRSELLQGFLLLADMTGFCGVIVGVAPQSPTKGRVLREVHEGARNPSTEHLPSKRLHFMRTLSKQLMSGHEPWRTTSSPTRPEPLVLPRNRRTLRTSEESRTKGRPPQ